MAKFYPKHLSKTEGTGQGRDLESVLPSPEDSRPCPGPSSLREGPSGLLAESASDTEERWVRHLLTNVSLLYLANYEILNFIFGMNPNLIGTPIPSCNYSQSENCPWPG